MFTHEEEGGWSPRRKLRKRGKQEDFLSRLYLDFAHFGVREAKLGIQKIGIEFEFSSEAPA
jgi:hypothetical protein